MITYSALKMTNLTSKLIWNLGICIILITISCADTKTMQNDPQIDATLSSPTKELPINNDTLTQANISLITTDISVGFNRLAFALINKDTNTLVKNENINLRLSKVDENKMKTLDTSVSNTPKLVEIDRGYSHLHDDGSTHFHNSGSIGVYVSQVMLPKAGHWLMEISSTDKALDLQASSVLLQVREHSLSPVIGSHAPLSKQLLLEQVNHISEIDTSSPPNPNMHKISVHEAMNNSMPTVIVFASPGFCMSLTCGTTKLLVDNLYKKYKDSANFIHIEPYDLNKARNNQGLIPINIMYDWGLQSEPWVFFIDSQGNIASKFEGVVTKSEMETAFESLQNNLVK